MTKGSQVDWSQTNTYIRGTGHPYNLFGLQGDKSNEIVRWWPGDVTHETPLPKSGPLDGVLTWLLGIFMVLVALGMAPKEWVPGPLVGFFEKVAEPAARLYGILLVLGALYVVVLLPLRLWLFPSQKDAEFREKFRRQRELAEGARTLTVVLWLGSGKRPNDQTMPLKISRDRNSAATTTATLPRDRYVYLTLNDLTDAEYAELKKRLMFMDIPAH